MKPRRLRDGPIRVSAASLLPLAVAALFLRRPGMRAVQLFRRATFFPRRWRSRAGIGELAQQGLLLKYIVASLFRVTWGFALAVLIGVPLGLLLGWFAPRFSRRSIR